MMKKKPRQICAFNEKVPVQLYQYELWDVCYKRANGGGVKARLKSVAFKGFKPYDLFVTGAMLSVQNCLDI